jgi:Tol biopolymer transport system component
VSDLKERFQSLDRIPAPDLWRDISRREPGDLKLGTSWRRVAMAALALAVAAAGIGVATWAFVGGRDSRRVLRPDPFAPKANGMIAFSGGYDLPYTWDAVYLVNPDGTGLRRLTQEKRRFRELSWSPDGSRLVGTDGSSVDGGTVHLIVIDQSGDIRQITDGQVVDIFPTWTPDGSRILFSRGTYVQSELNGYDLFSVSADGSGLRQLTRTAGGEWSAQLSPDGKNIVYLGDSGNGRLNVYVMRSDGTDVRRLTKGVLATDWSPKWSPDGSKLAFVRERLKGEDSIVLINTNGTGSQEMFRCKRPLCQALRDLSWAPDGTAVVFSVQSVDSQKHMTLDLYLVRPDGSGLRRLTQGILACCPVWQPISGTP